MDTRTVSHPLVTHLRSAMQDAADPAKAPSMRAYMKTDQPFYGVQATPRRKIFRAAIKLHPIRSRAEYAAAIRDLWGGVHREEMYLALDLAERVKAYRDIDAWPLFVDLMRTASNWDTLDWIAATLLGDLLGKHREKEAEVRAWRDDPNLWVRRTSLLVHLKHKTDTNVPLLAETILHLAHETDFFIRKAIGWNLREYAKTDPDWVRTFVAEHADQLSGLSKREALKNLSG